MPNPLECLSAFVWHTGACEGGDVDRLASRASDAGLRTLLFKAGDGGARWPFTRDVVDRCARHGIAAGAWVYIYGGDPEAEAQVAIAGLDQGAACLVIDAEGEYERLANNGAAANRYMGRIRQRYPHAFIAHAPFPIISYHSRFPYVEFGRWCDAVLPQDYWQDIAITPERMLQWMDQEWAAFAARCRRWGVLDAVKPLYPIGQGYHHPGPALERFLELCRHDGGASVWSYEHMDGQDWASVRNASRLYVPAPTIPRTLTQPPPPPTPKEKTYMLQTADYLQAQPSPLNTPQQHDQVVIWADAERYTPYAMVFNPNGMPITVTVTGEGGVLLGRITAKAYGTGYHKVADWKTNYYGVLVFTTTSASWDKDANRTDTPLFLAGIGTTFQPIEVRNP